MVEIYTDGSSIGNPGPGGYGIVMQWKGKNIKKNFIVDTDIQPIIEWNYLQL